MILIANDEQDGIRFLNIFNVEHTCRTDADALTEMRRQLKEWGKTEDGIEAAVEAVDDFCWGDLSQWEKVIKWEYPILSVKEEWGGSGHDINHDEQLLREDNDD